MDLQKGPLGILGWFSLKVTGRNPPGFGDSVVPVVEVGDNYLATSELQLQIATTNLSLATFNGTTFTVPNGKCWRLIAASWAVGLNAADVALRSFCEIGIGSPNSAPNNVIVAQNDQAGGILPRAVGATWRPPIFVPSGWTVAVTMITSGAITVAVPRIASVMYQEVDL
jgi:hypothetical protein